MIVWLLTMIIGSVLSASSYSGVGSETQTTRSMTMMLDSRLTCFFEPLEAGTSIRLAVTAEQMSDQTLQLRFTSPSGDLSDWRHGFGSVGSSYNVTEKGDHEICIHSNRPERVVLTISFYRPDAFEAAFAKWLEENELSTSVQEIVSRLIQSIFKIKYSIKYYNGVAHRDQERQQINADRIQNFSISFCVVAIIIAAFQVYFVRRMFFVDEKRIRI